MKSLFIINVHKSRFFIVLWYFYCVSYFFLWLLFSQNSPTAVWLILILIWLIIVLIFKPLPGLEITKCPNI